jgi:starch phosphorylase
MSGDPGALDTEIEATPRQNTARAIKRDLLEKLFSMQGKFPAVATRNDYYLALAYAVRERLMHRWISTVKTYFEGESRTAVYLSAEFLLGPQLGTNLINLGISAEARQAVAELGLHLDELLEQEEEPGLGNGGLGRLAACYMDSMATLQIPAIGYGIRYEFGIFDQVIRDGWQVEMTDKWLRLGNPWEIPRPEIGYPVKLGGHTEAYTDEAGRYSVRWVPHRVVMGTPYDTPILGYGVNTANMLRLWRAEACESFDFQAFNVGDYYRAVDEKVVSENITKVLYPNDDPDVGKRLRLEQQYFFVSCSLQDMIRIYRQREATLDHFHRKYVVQLNDTHPALAVAELMRLLVDEHRMDWDRAWEITTSTFAYTNHTLLPEALETWAVPLFGRVLPRHLEIVYEINRRFLDRVRREHPGDEGRIARVSLIGEAGQKRVRMANLACVGSFAVNGVAKLHSELLKATVLRDFYELWPEKFGNKTNGVSPRRFMALANPGLSRLITEAIGDRWVRDLDELTKLEPLAGDAAFRGAWRRVKQDCKRALADRIKADRGVDVDPASLFDVQVKRIHEYKRQLLAAMHAIDLYLSIVEDGVAPVVPRTVIFAGKAAPEYFVAKRVIHLLNAIATTVNADPRARGLLSVVFLPDYRVSLAERIIPGADLSEQISTAGKEASGTGNMKLALNGALTIGTLDGANIEIREAVGDENIYIFGLRVDESRALRESGYDPGEHCRRSPRLARVVESLVSGRFHPDPGTFRPLHDNLLAHGDPYFHLADFGSYWDAQRRAEADFSDPDTWDRMAVLNVARMGPFSSDRAIREYAKEIWQLDPVA